MHTYWHTWCNIVQTSHTQTISLLWFYWGFFQTYFFRNQEHKSYITDTFFSRIHVRFWILLQNNTKESSAKLCFKRISWLDDFASRWSIGRASISTLHRVRFKTDLFHTMVTPSFLDPFSYATSNWVCHLRYGGTHGHWVLAYSLTGKENVLSTCM